MLKTFASIFFVLSVAVTSLAHAANKSDGSHIQPDNYYPRVKIETSMGDIVVELDRRRAPITVNNFLRYVDKRSYEDTIFHRIVPGFVVQGGGYTTDFEGKSNFPAIFNESGNGLTNDLHTIAMARQNDPHTANRQFFFNVNDNESLNPGRDWGYAVFGLIVEGEDVVDAMSEVETEYSLVLNANNVPIEPIVIKKVTVLPPL
ncbi:peptidylprolyl isomerase [Alteromonas australica]|jgi:peptidyl-prolyl cis-trans isomerase A (cyclophilin A)|uniref:Peptidyl-prolyl cis-trans isomerase n=1 Tax=Alteromonas australica TaxID=589873 RepID=A0A358DYS3_9ALTE|nr:MULTISPECIES: peptidylprolyl isomerase [Alteromonas]MAB93930.1 peptidylprolyl isomerase [Alteromonas sp.]AJP42870.1 peptidylprolyl isomerase [Alteromonas australica]MAF72269.1 peptidylprolyl isomerase [Alteromonas sp.]MAO31755.1 peptidylprolyl isomerase [Alteromonas sp.]MBU34619.1 peptidylprolyl isomerase [Alteromonas sp.]|tara:strand:+ start:284 stop:892 length:609 start_codon:yes stop_codon:yes gene_type:complete